VTKDFEWEVRMVVRIHHRDIELFTHLNALITKSLHFCCRPVQAGEIFRVWALVAVGLVRSESEKVLDRQPVTTTSPASNPV